MKRSRIVNILVLMLAMMMLLSACQGTTSTPAVTTKAQTSPGTTAVATTAIATTAGPKPVLELTALLIQYATPPDQNAEFWKTIEKTFNIHYKNIEWVSDAAYLEKLNLVLGSGTVPDIVYTVTVADPTVYKAIQGGMFADLTPVLGDFSKYPNLKLINPDAWNTSKVDGKMFLFPRSRGRYDMPIAHVRGDWLDKLGMKIPTTFDEFSAYLKAVCTADLDGNGKKDTIGITGVSLQQWASAFGAGDKKIVNPAGKTTGIVNVRLTESYALMLDYLHGMYDQGLISSEYALLKGQQQEDLYVAGKSAMYQKNIWHRKRMDNELQKIDPKAYSALMFSLKGPDGDAFNCDKGWAGGLLVSSKVGTEKLTRIVEFMNQTADPKNFNLVSFGIEGTDYTIVDGFPQLTAQGTKEISLALTYPFTYASQTYAKVDSPLADAKYNLATRKMTNDGLDPIYAKYANPLSLEILQSNSWASFMSQKKDEIAAFETAVITGTKTVAEFRTYQKTLLQDPNVIKSFDEFQKNFDNLGLKK